MADDTQRAPDTDSASADQTPAEGKKKTSQLGRILLYGAVLGVIAATAMYFWTYESEDVGPSTAERGILFHKIAPPAVLATYKIPAYPKPAVERTPSVPETPTPSPVATESTPAPPAPEPKAAPVPAAAAPAPPASHVVPYAERSYPYVVHLASYEDLEYAKKKLAEYRRGFKAFLVRSDLGKKGVWYRLHIGHFPDASSAADAIDKYFTKGAVVGHTRYACLVGSYTSADASAALFQQLAEKGFLPYTMAIDGTYHVFVGAHPSWGAVAALSEDLANQGFPTTIVKR